MKYAAQRTPRSGKWQSGAIRPCDSQPTGLLLKTRTKVSTADSTENAIEEVNLFKEYKKVDGVLFPMQLVILHDGAKFAEANFYDVKLSETLPAADFTVPDSRK